MSKPPNITCNRSLQEFLFLSTLFIIFSCYQNDQHQSNSPIAVEAKGRIVPKDSMPEPKVKPADENKVDEILAGKPTVVHTNTNVHLAGKPKIVLAGKPRICI